MTPPVDNGYILTKWAAERLVARVAEHYGIPAIIARPGNITGSTRTGYTNYASNHFWLFNKGCLQLGHFPDVPAVVEMMPVDILARAIAALSLTATDGLFVANLANPARISQHRFFELLAAAGSTAKPQAVPDWQREVAAVGEDNGLSTIKDFYLGELAAEDPDIVQAATLARLGDLGVPFEADCAGLVPTYVKYLSAEGFLPETGAVRA
ncbi:MAG: SDR family oxidoreductase [Candidatus Sericytochromatia bacterium]|uniref:SDR family oxidoreductase n=1 Tax=Candidatus Tanganyikabacteria bacterium TaxID=2961651 RepID=A0A938BJX7_9BACT|nr:SDR family oxidoreductase [Candidatus Tanganyikabacteria bacterium]